MLRLFILNLLTFQTPQYTLCTYISRVRTLATGISLEGIQRVCDGLHLRYIVTLRYRSNIYVCCVKKA